LELKVNSAHRDVFLNYSSIVTGLGSLNPTWESLLANKSGIVQKAHFENELLPKTGLSLYQRDLHSEQADFTEMLMGHCLAGFPKLPPDTLVIWTGIKNDVEAIESLYNGASMPHCLSARDLRLRVTDILGLSGGGMEINAACASSTIGVALAVQYIAAGRYDHILVAGADRVSRFVYLGFAALKAMKEDVCLPFDTQRNGLSLGDGAVALFLSAERNSDIRVAGYGITNDANHITGPSRDGSGLAKALNQAIAMSGLQSQDVQAFCAHGTGTRYNDAMEILAARLVFGEDENSPPLFGIKGAIGHTLGAAGGIEIALCGKCLSEGILPPTVGCKSPESPSVVLDQTRFPGRNILTSNSGFGGINAAVLMERVS
jgi:3-oxoacyl-(acyl-carrier-protein) synthase